MGKFWSILLRLPMWILVLASCAVAYYAVYAKLMEGLTWAVPGIYTAIIILYFLGISIKNKVDKADAEEESKVDVVELKEVEDEYKALQKRQNEINEVEDEESKCS
jgi:F420-0:gamma-glutamyl ligase-like protein